MLSKKTKGTWSIKHNKNISIPIGNAVLSEAFFRKYGLNKVISKLKKKGTNLGKLTEPLVAYKLRYNFSILKAHDFIMQPEIRQRFGINEFDVKGLYRAVERLGESRKTVIAAFRNKILGEYGPEVIDIIFDCTSLVYFGYKPELVMQGLSKDGHPEECQMTIGISQLTKHLCIPIGITVMPGNTHDRKHMIGPYAQVKDDFGTGKTMIFNAGATVKMF